ncbi:helix-turn-helix domain-containing protein [Streptomyces sp. NPDC054940]
MRTRTELDRGRLKRRRIEAGLNLTQLAQRAGISKQLVSMVEKGNANFSPDNLRKVAEVLGCEVADLLPVDEALSQFRQLTDLVASGRITLSPQELPRVAETLGCEVADLDPEDLAKMAQALGCEIADLHPDEEPTASTGSAA